MLAALYIERALMVDQIQWEVVHEGDPVRHFCTGSATEDTQPLGLNDEK